MAALKNHGYEVARVGYPMRVGETEYEVTLSFRSDGHVLRKLKALNIHPHGEPHHDYGWKLWARIKDPKRDTARRMTTLAHRCAEQNPGL